VEVADVLHAQGEHFVEQHSWLSVQQRTVLRALRRCRTAALGGHLDQCGTCGHRAISYNSCRNRHCPKCQAQARARWLAARERELLDVSYVHVVFTLPHTLNPLCRRNAARLYDLLFRASAATLIEVAADPRHLGAEIGFLSILHTWGQTLVRHPHVHCVVPAGGFSPDHQRWVRPKYPSVFLPVKVLSRVFRGKFVEGLRRAYVRGELDLRGATATLQDPARWHALVDALFQTGWVVYAKPAFGGAAAVLRYLGRYTHRVAISNHRLLAFDGERITFRWKDYAHDGQWDTMTLTACEPAHPAARLRPHSPVRLSRQRVSHRASHPGASAPRRPTVTSGAPRGLVHAGDGVAVPAVWRGHHDRTLPHGDPTDAIMARLRYVVVVGGPRDRRGGQTCRRTSMAWSVSAATSSPTRRLATPVHPRIVPRRGIDRSSSERGADASAHPQSQTVVLVAP
jgi:Putative transposase/Transposase zinc-binding domain